MCVCYLTAALIRPLWVRLIGPVIRDAALPPSPVRWITSHCRLLCFQDKWTEGESITPHEREGERSGDRIPYRDTEEDAEVGSVGKKVGSTKKAQNWDRGNSARNKKWFGPRQKREVEEKKVVWWRLPQRPAARSAPFLAPSPLTG